MTKAQEHKALYNAGIISRKDAVVGITPYIDACNEKSKELAKKYNQRPKLVTVMGFLR